MVLLAPTAAGAIGALLALAPATAAQEPPDSLPGDVVAQVDSRQIPRTRFDHLMESAAAGRESPGVPAPDTTEYADLRDEVMSYILSHTWIQLEAGELGVRIGNGTARRVFLRQKRESFRTERAYQRFLRDSKLTTADLIDRTRIDLLSDAIRRHVVRPAKTEDGEILLLDRFIRGFERKWRARTTCARGFRTRECGRVVPVGS